MTIVEIKDAIIEELSLLQTQNIVIGFSEVDKVLQMYTTDKLKLIEIICNISDNIRISYACSSIVSVCYEKK